MLTVPLSFSSFSSSSSSSSSFSTSSAAAAAASSGADNDETIRLRKELAATRETILQLEARLNAEEISTRRSRINPRFPTVDYNYGYLSRSVGVYLDNSNAGGDMGPPLGLLPLAVRNFKREFKELLMQIIGVEPTKLQTPGE